MKIYINFESVIYLILVVTFSHLTDKHFTKNFNPNYYIYTTVSKKYVY